MNINQYRWSNEEDFLLKELYLNKKSKLEILTSFPNRTYSAIKHRARTLKIKKIRQQIKNECFFNIPNEINSSIAGMIASDGNVQYPKGKNGYRIIFGLSQKDKEILLNIIKITDSNANIGDYCFKKIIKTNRNKNPIEKEYKSSTVCFSNAKEWINDLQKHWNITENKSLTLTAPNFNELNLSLAYILGIINGDGTIGIQKSGNKEYFYIRLLGTRNLLEWAKNRFEEALNEKIEGRVHIEREGAGVYLLQVNGIQAIRLFEKMKVLNCIQLARKWQNPEILNLIKEYKQKYPNYF